MARLIHPWRSVVDLRYGFVVADGLISELDLRARDRALTHRRSNVTARRVGAMSIVATDEFDVPAWS
jgi:hypothetical protein